MRKLCQELGQAQRHAFLLSQRSAVTELAMFLQLFEQLQIAKGEPAADIHLPMDRSDIGEYMGITLAAVSRAFRSLTTRGIIRVRDRHHVRIVDRSGFEKISLAIPHKCRRSRSTLSPIEQLTTGASLANSSRAERTTSENDTEPTFLPQSTMSAM
jgi:DNA-binding transcriptional regulator YhcF (GntR family)